MTDVRRGESIQTLISNECALYKQSEDGVYTRIQVAGDDGTILALWYDSNNINNTNSI